MSSALEFLVNLGKLPSPSQKLVLPVDDKASIQAAEACGVIAFKNLQASFRFKRWRKHGVSVLCDFSAQVEQECIATLEPVISKLQGGFERQFLPERSSDYKMPEIIDGEMILDPEADWPDIIENDTINLWDVVIEEMILAINPFPRANSMEEANDPAQKEVPEISSESTHRPFSDLKALITEKKSNK